MRHFLPKVLVAALFSGAALCSEDSVRLPADAAPLGLAIVRNRLCVAAGPAGGLVYSLPELKLLKRLEPLPIFGSAIHVTASEAEGLAAIQYQRGWVQFVTAAGEVLSCLPVQGLTGFDLDGRTVATLRYFYEGLKVKKKVRELACGRVGTRRARIRGRLRFTDDFEGVAASDGIALVTTVRKGKQTVSVIDVSNVAAPGILDHLTELGSVESVSAGHGRGYVCSADRGLWLVPLAKYRSRKGGERPEDTLVDPSAEPGFALRRTEIPGGAKLAAASDALAVVAGPTGVHIVAIDEIELRIVHSLDGISAAAIAIGGKFAAVSDGRSSIRVIDISDPERPRTVGQLQRP